MNGLICLVTSCEIGLMMSGLRRYEESVSLGRLISPDRTESAEDEMVISGGEYELEVTTESSCD